MNKKTTPSHQQCPKEKNSVESKRPRVSEQTLAFLRSFAGNYYVEPTIATRVTRDYFGINLLLPFIPSTFVSLY